MHNGYGSGSVDITIETAEEEATSDDGAEAVTVAGHEGIYHRIDAPRRRRILAGGLLAIGAAVVLLGVVLAVGQGPLMPGTVCLTFEADDSLTEGACPPTVIPPERSDSAVITVEVAHADPGWIEGGFFFMRATSAEGDVVLEQPLEFQFSGAEGPAASGVQPPPPTANGEAHLPPGSYQFTVYSRNCNGNCNWLGPAQYVCHFPITATANQQLAIEYDWNDCLDR